MPTPPPPPSPKATPSALGEPELQSGAASTDSVALKLEEGAPQSVDNLPQPLPAAQGVVQLEPAPSRAQAGHQSEATEDATEAGTGGTKGGTDGSHSAGRSVEAAAGACAAPSVVPTGLEAGRAEQLVPPSEALPAAPRKAAEAVTGGAVGDGEAVAAEPQSEAALAVGRGSGSGVTPLSSVLRTVP